MKVNDEISFNSRRNASCGPLDDEPSDILCVECGIGWWTMWNALYGMCIETKIGKPRAPSYTEKVKSKKKKKNNNNNNSKLYIFK